MKVETFKSPDHIVYWGQRQGVKAPVMLQAPEGKKHHAIRDQILPWYLDNGIHIANSSVYFFDDIQVNVDGVSGDPLEEFGYKATLVSKASRDHHRGRCGGTSAEVDALVPPKVKATVIEV